MSRERTPQARATPRRAMQLALMYIQNDLDDLRTEAREQGDKKVADGKEPYLRHGSIEATVMHAMDLAGCAGILRTMEEQLEAKGMERFHG